MILLTCVLHLGLLLGLGIHEVNDHFPYFSLCLVQSFKCRSGRREKLYSPLVDNLKIPNSRRRLDVEEPHLGPNFICSFTEFRIPKKIMGDH